MLGLIFTYTMAYGGSAVALVSPWVGFLIYVSFAILQPGFGLWYWSVPRGNYSKVLAISLLIGWAARGFGNWRLGQAGIGLFALFGYLVWNAVATTQAVVPEVAWDWVESQAKIVIPVLVGTSLINSVRELKQLAWVVLLSHGYAAFDLNLSYFGGFNRLHEAGFGFMDNNCMGISLVSCTGLGIFLCLGTPRLWQKAVAVGCIGLMVHAIMFSMSRGAMLGLILVVGLSFLLIPKRPVHYLALLGGVLLTVSTTGPEVIKRFDSAFAEGGERDNSAQSRLDMWGICARVAVERPVFGLGPAQFHVHAAEFGLPAGKEAHTTWLQMAAELGIPGVVFLLMFFVVPPVALWRVSRERFPVPDPFFRDIARMVIAATAGYLFTAQFVTLPGLEAPYYITMLGAGVLKLLANPDLLATGGPAARTAEDTCR